MPFNEKVNLEQYFKDEIERVSSSEIRAVETQIEDIRSNAIKDIEAEAQLAWWKSRSCASSTANLRCA